MNELTKRWHWKDYAWPATHSNKPLTEKQKIKKINVNTFAAVDCLRICKSYVSFSPTPFQPLQFQPCTLSAKHSFNRFHFRQLAKWTAAISTYLIEFKVFQVFQDVRKNLEYLKIQLGTISREVSKKFHLSYWTNNIRTKHVIDISELLEKTIRYNLHLTRTTNLKNFGFFQLLWTFSEAIDSPLSKCTSDLTRDSVSWIEKYSQGG